MESADLLVSGFFFCRCCKTVTAIVIINLKEKGGFL